MFKSENNNKPKALKLTKISRMSGNRVRAKRKKKGKFEKQPYAENEISKEPRILKIWSRISPQPIAKSGGRKQQIKI